MRDKCTSKMSVEGPQGIEGEKGITPGHNGKSDSQEDKNKCKNEIDYTMIIVDVHLFRETRITVQPLSTTDSDCLYPSGVPVLFKYSDNLTDCTPVKLTNRERSLYLVGLRTNVAGKESIIHNDTYNIAMILVKGQYVLPKVLEQLLNKLHDRIDCVDLKYKIKSDLFKNYQITNKLQADVVTPPETNIIKPTKKMEFSTPNAEYSSDCVSDTKPNTNESVSEQRGLSGALKEDINLVIVDVDLFKETSIIVQPLDEYKYKLVINGNATKFRYADSLTKGTAVGMTDPVVGSILDRLDLCHNNPYKADGLITNSGGAYTISKIVTGYHSLADIVKDLLYKLLKDIQKNTLKGGVSTESIQSKIKTEISIFESYGVFNMWSAINPKETKPTPTEPVTNVAKCDKSNDRVQELELEVFALKQEIARITGKEVKPEPEKDIITRVVAEITYDRIEWKVERYNFKTRDDDRSVYTANAIDRLIETEDGFEIDVLLERTPRDIVADYTIKEDYKFSSATGDSIRCEVYTRQYDFHDIRESLLTNYRLNSRITLATPNKFIQEDM